MSRVFRPVIEMWGEASSEFLDHDDLVTFFDVVAEAAGTHTEVMEYGEVTSIYIEDGDAFLKYFEEGKADAKTLLGSVTFSSDDPADIKHVISNIKNMAGEWRALIHPKHGSLTFYLD